MLKNLYHLETDSLNNYKNFIFYRITDLLINKPKCTLVLNCVIMTKIVFSKARFWTHYIIEAIRFDNFAALLNLPQALILLKTKKSKK
jgi:hypothetical protein